MRRLFLLLALLGIAACGSTPTEVFTLTASSDRAARPVPAGGAPVVQVDRASVAEYFDRTQMVTRIGEHRVSLHEFAVWSEPIADLITGGVVDDLARRFGDDRVMRTPARGRGVLPADLRVEMDVLRFDVDEGGVATLDVRWAVLPEGRGESGRVQRRERILATAADPASASSRVLALRETVTVLASHIGDAVARAVPRR